MIINKNRGLFKETKYYAIKDYSVWLRKFLYINRFINVDFGRKKEWSDCIW